MNIDKWDRCMRGGHKGMLKIDVTATTTQHPFRGIVQDCMDFVPPGDYKVILGIGAGDAWEVDYLSKKFNAKGYAVSINPTEKNIAMRLYPAIHFELTDAHDLPNCWDTQFDLITMRDSLEHMLAPFLVLEECWRVLKPNGLLMIAVPDQKWQEWHEHLIVPTELQMKHLLNLAGFKLIKMQEKVYPKECALTQYLYLAQKEA